MTRLPLAASLSGIFPMVSYLHVPKTMPQPVWLMLGSAFVIDKEAIGLDAAFSAKHDVLMLTAAHTLAPWRCYKCSIPDEWRKGRYVTGKVLQYDAFGAADISRTVDFGVLAVHPTVDVALVKVFDGAKFRAYCRQGPKDAPAEETVGDNDTWGTFDLVSPAFGTEPSTSAASSIEVSCVGFRGRGDLGETQQLTQEEMNTMPAPERQRRIDEHKTAPGKQDVNIVKLKVVKEPAVADVPPLVPMFVGEGPTAPASSIYSRALVGGSGRCYAGMSGSPLVLPPMVAAPGTSRRCAAGLLFQAGLAERKNTEVLYVPADAIASWLRSLK